MFLPSEKLTYIAKYGMSSTVYCRCGDSVNGGSCHRCGRKNIKKNIRRKEKIEYLKKLNQECLL